jgi:hypothetical protein
MLGRASVVSLSPALAGGGPPLNPPRSRWVERRLGTDA